MLASEFTFRFPAHRRFNGLDIRGENRIWPMNESAGKSRILQRD
jgi:hypothetical protein